jgi:predicted DNA-binding transcriptional regulator AlpA
MKTNSKHIVALKIDEFQEMVEDAVIRAIDFHQSTQKVVNANEELVPRIDVARELKISPTTLYIWTKKGLFPRPLSISSRVYYRRSEIEQFKKQKL